MNQKTATFKKVFVYVLGAISGAALTFSAQSFAQNQKDSIPVQDIRTMAEVYAQIKANYYQETKDDKLLNDAIKGMVAGLDPHSDYMTPKDFKDLNEDTSGEFGGLGMEIGKQDNYIKVISPIEDTPAERAGIKSGDLIVKIDGDSTSGMSTTRAVKKMRGKPGTKITLTLSRKDVNQPIVVTLTRAIIKTKSIRSKLLEPGYAYIRITQFQERTLNDLIANIKQLEAENKAPLQGVVVDLRDDPGGLLNQAVGVSAVFLPKNSTVVSTKGRDGRETMNLKATLQDYLPGKSSDPLSTLPPEIKTIPIVILVNSGTASASEIVSGALQDHKRAVVMGIQSFGKGSVQTVLPLSNGGGVKITTALYYTPNGRSIQAQGIVPDIEVKPKKAGFEIREADLGGHLSNPLGGSEIKGSEDTPAAEAASAASAPDVNHTDSKQDAKSPKENKKDEKDEPEYNPREPDPVKDKQLGEALKLIKDPQQWQKSLGLAAQKPAPKKDKDTNEDDSED